MARKAAPERQTRRYRQASKSMYEARMRQYRYSEDDIQTVLAAWLEMRTSELESE